MFDIICDHAPFCVSRDFVAASELTGLVVAVDSDGRPLHASPDAIERLGVHIEWVANDVFTDVAPARLRQACRDDVCVVFRVSCQELTCSWQAAPINNDLSAHLSEVRLTASSPAALERGKANVFVAVPGPTVDGLLSLSILGEGDPAPPRAYQGPATEADFADQARRRTAN